jgi:hypothetical protein
LDTKLGNSRCIQLCGGASYNSVKNVTIHVIIQHRTGTVKKTGMGIEAVAY